MEIDTTDHDHAHRDDNGDATGDGAPDGAKKEQDHLHYEIYNVSRGLVSVTYPPEQ